MFRKIIITILLFVLTGCASTKPAPTMVNPTIPENTHNSSYRKVIEILVVSNCIRRTIGDSINYITVVESSSTGERFEMNGCYGKKGERFKIGY